MKAPCWDCNNFRSASSCSKCPIGEYSKRCLPCEWAHWEADHFTCWGCGTALSEASRAGYPIGEATGTYHVCPDRKTKADETSTAPITMREVKGGIRVDA